MIIQHNIPLQPLTTFGVPATARYYTLAHSTQDIIDAIQWAKEQVTRPIILGGGSNILFTEDIDSLILHIGLKGIQVELKDEHKRLVTIAAGENWSETVWWAAQQGFGGIENLYHIPGTAGAAAVQNIGAYGVELGDICQYVTALHLPTCETHDIPVEDCQFGYRQSLFKQHPEQWIVLSISLLLDTKAPLNTDYGALHKTLAQQMKEKSTSPGYADVALAVATIRESKLPSPETIGSAGSFFKNPVVNEATHEALIEKHPHMPAYALPNGDYKLSASWLLDTAGWKEKGTPTVGCYQSQPLVIVNKGGAKGSEILHFSQTIQDDIQQRFRITLEREVVVFPMDASTRT